MSDLYNRNLLSLSGEPWQARPGAFGASPLSPYGGSTGAAATQGNGNQ